MEMWGALEIGTTFPEIPFLWGGGECGDCGNNFLLLLDIFVSCVCVWVVLYILEGEVGLGRKVCCLLDLKQQDLKPVVDHLF